MSGDDRIDEVIAGHMPQRLTPEPFDQGPKTDLAGVERRVSALERHLFDPCETADPSETEENADKPPSAPEALELVKGSIAAPGYLIGDRADRANALLGTVETILATGGAAETHGVRIEPCDEYGRTETTRRADSLAARAEFFRLQLDRARRERDAALAGAESAEKDLERAEALFSAIKLPADDGPEPAQSADEEIGRGLIVCGAQRLADVGGGRHVLVECELFEHSDDEPHHAAPRGPVTW